MPGTARPFRRGRPEFDLFDRFPVTGNDTATTARVAEAFADFFADRLDTGTQALIVAALAWLAR